MQRVIDTHVHHLEDSQVAWARELGYDRVCLLDYRPEVLVERMRAHPDFVVGIGWLPMDRDIPRAALDKVDCFRDIGCRGYKVCFTSRPYDDESYYPIYEKIEATGMPVFFHTGWLDQRVALGAYPAVCRPRADYFHPMTLDRLALDFPRLRMVAYHLGGSYLGDCALLMRNHANLYADTCRSFDPFEFFRGHIGGQAGVRAVFGKLMVGSDGMGAPQMIRERLEELGRLMDYLRIPEGLRQRVYYKTALRVLGMDEELRRVATAGRAGGAVDLGQALAGTVAGPVTEGFVDLLGQPAGAGTRCWIACTETGLRLVFRCADERASQVAITRGGPLGEIWQDDSVEAFVSPANDGTYWHVVASAGGRAFVHQGRYGSEVQELPAQARVGPDAWAVAVEVPFAVLGARPAAGALWGLNLCRTKATAPTETSSWNEVASTFHDPAAFGYLRFE